MFSCVPLFFTVCFLFAISFPFPSNNTTSALSINLSEKLTLNANELLVYESLVSSAPIADVTNVLYKKSFV